MWPKINNHDLPQGALQYVQHTTSSVLQCGYGKKPQNKNPFNWEKKNGRNFRKRTEQKYTAH